MFLGWFLGGRYREIYANLMAFRRNNNRSDAAAWLIENALNFEQAMSIFQDARTARSPFDRERVWAAMTARMQLEGPTPETLAFLAGEKVTGFPDDTEAAELAEDIEFERLKHYAWMVAEFIDAERQRLKDKDKQ